MAFALLAYPFRPVYLLQGNEPQWLDADTMGQQIESMVESAVSYSLARATWLLWVERFSTWCFYVTVLLDNENAHHLTIHRLAV